MFCCTLLYVHSSIAIILMGKRELVALLNLSSWCLVMVERLFLAVLGGCLRFVIVVFPDHTHLLFLIHSIPHSWKTKFKNENTNTPNPHTILSQLMNTKHTNKYVCNLLQKKRKHPDKKLQTKWTEQFHDENLNWKTIYTSSLRAAKAIKLQNFNFKFLMRIIPTNRFLLKCNIGHTTLCDFCSMEIETLDHLF